MFPLPYKKYAVAFCGLVVVATVATLAHAQERTSDGKGTKGTGEASEIRALLGRYNDALNAGSVAVRVGRGWSAAPGARP